MTDTARRRLTGSVQHMYFVAVDGEPFLAVARAGGVEIVDATDNESVRIVYDLPTDALDVLPGPDGQPILLVGGPDGHVYGLDPVTGEVRLDHALGAGPVKDIEAFHDSATPAVVAGLDSGVYVWQPGADTADRLPDPDGMESDQLFKVCAYTVGTDKWVTCAYTDGSLATWRLDGRPPTRQRGHDGPIWSLINTVDADGRPIVVSGGSDRRMRVWEPDPSTGLLRAREEFTADGTIRRLGHLVSSGSTMLLTATATGAVSLWRLGGFSDRPEMVLSRHSGEAWALVCTATTDGVLVASGGMNGDIKIKRLSTALLTAESVSVLFDTTATLWAVTHGTTPRGPYIACAGVGQTVTVLDPSGRHETIGLREHSSTVRALTALGGTATGGQSVEPHLLSGGADHRLLDWDPATGQLRAEVPMGHQGEIWALTSFVDGGVPYVVSGSVDGSVRLMALDGAADAPRILATNCGEVSSVVAVPTDDDILVVLASARGLQAVPVRREHVRPMALSLHGMVVACGVQDADRHLVVAARQDGVVELIDPLKGVSVSTFAVSYGAGQVRALEAVKVGGTTFVLGGCDDGRVLVWHLDGTLVGQPVHAGSTGIRSMDVVELAMPEDTRRPGQPRTRSALVTAGNDGTVRLWPVTLDSPLRAGGSVARRVRPASILLQDQPTSTDLLARDPLVDTLYDALTSDNTRPPVVVGVHAPWGHGKSSLLRQLRSRVDPWSDRGNGTGDGNGAPAAPAAPAAPPAASHRLSRPDGGRVPTRLTRAWAWSQIQRSGDRNAPLEYEMRPVESGRHDTITVWFNPWMYERTDQIWAGLTREILVAVTERLSKADRERLWFDLNLRRTDAASMRKRILASYIPRSIWGLLVGALLLFMVAVAVVSMGIAAVNNPEVAELLGPSTLILLTVLVTIAQLTSGSFKQIHGWVSPDELNNRGGPEHAWKGAQDPLTSTDRGYLYMLQHDVGDVVGLATRYRPLYVFIDDLDRCKPAIVADTVEAINLFLNKAFGKCVFVIGLDPATVAAHLETSFSDIGYRAREDPTSFGHLRYTGWRFMEKIIDLPIRLPRVPDTALSRYVDALLDPAVADRPTGDGGIAGPDRPVDRPAVRADRTRRLPKARRELARGSDGAFTLAPTAASGHRDLPGRSAAELLGLPDRGTADTAIATVDALEALPPVRDALRAAVLSLPSRSPRQTKAFINLWRFYMVLDHRMGLFSPSLLAIERHSIEMARLVELMVRWPYLLGPLGEFADIGVAEPTTHLELLVTASDRDDETWNATARRARLDPDDRDVRGLRQLLLRAHPPAQVFIGIARRYL